MCTTPYNEIAGHEAATAKEWTKPDGEMAGELPLKQQQRINARTGHLDDARRQQQQQNHLGPFVPLRTGDEEPPN
ncbi:hypothetical protein TYRP_019022 [Tyrophagus putrescentiae]|nr:hypothetical protein TYRP_019022 [Tyrophagus putrescentiae]